MKNLDINYLLELGLKNHQENKLDKAEYYYDEVIKENKENIKANLYLGIVFAQQKKFIEAKTQFEKTLNVSPKNIDALNNLGLVYKELNEIDNSLDCFKKVIAINSNFITSYNNLSILYQNLKKYSEAEKILIKALDIDSNNLEIKLSLAILYKDILQFEKSKKLFLEILDKNPKSLIALINYGNLLKNTGDKKESEKCFRKAIEINPKYFPAYNNLLVLYERTNQNNKLKELIDKAEINFKNNITLQLFHGHYLYKIEDFKSSLNILKNIKFNDNEYQKEKLRNLLLAKNYDKIDETNTAFEYFQKTNNISLKYKDRDIDKTKALKIISNRINYFKFQNKEISSNSNTNDSPVFLIGFPRSGTTLLDTILRSHPSIEVLEEKSNTTDMINSLNKIINGDLNNLENIQVDEIELLRNNYLESLKKNINSDISNKIIIDKMPLNIVHVGEIIKIFPYAKFILAIRHPCDCVLSCFMQNFRLNDSMANFLNIEDSSEMYNLVMTLWKHYEKLNINYQIVKYEDIVQNFKKTTESLLSFLKVPWTDNVLKFYEVAQSRNLINTPSYDQVYRPIYSESAYRWKKYEDKIKPILPILKPWINEFNY